MHGHTHTRQHTCTSSFACLRRRNTSIIWDRPAVRGCRRRTERSRSGPSGAVLDSRRGDCRSARASEPASRQASISRRGFSSTRYIFLDFPQHSSIFFDFSTLFRNFVIFGKFPVDVRIPPLRIRILLEWNPLRSRVSARGFAATSASGDPLMTTTTHFPTPDTCIYIYICMV